MEKISWVPLLRLCGSVVFLLGIVGCSDSGGHLTAPSALTSSPSPTSLVESNAEGLTAASSRLTGLAASSARIDSFTPSRISMRCEPQMVKANGGGFGSGLTVNVTDPAGRKGTLTGSQIRNITPSSFQMLLNTGTNHGWWTFQVGQSLPRVLIVDATIPQNTPYLRSMSPPRAVANGRMQTVSISGGNFQSGLIVIYTAPAGAKSNVTGTQIRALTPGTFQLTINFGNAGGLGAIQVTNPDCGQSGIPLSFIVDRR